ncbi:MAG: NYN domain-containing protein, partial [Rickettsiales bacterium]|nr:NYN domain-containing protein [Rickettsiales bacterium]
VIAYIDGFNLFYSPGVEIILGYFSVHKTQMPAADSDFKAGRIRMVDVFKTEEKGTDVNLAVQIVADAKDNKFDYAMLFSNDSDMARSIKIASRDCKKQIGLFVDRKARTFAILKENTMHIKRLSPNHFAAHQFPDEIKTSIGRIIRKPKDW